MRKVGNSVRVAVAQSSVNLLTIQLMRVLDLLNKLKEVEAKEEIRIAKADDSYVSLIV